MKRIIGFLPIAALFLVVACNNDKPAETKKEVIIVQPPAPVVVKEVPEKNTTVSVDKNGVKVETKKVDVTINPEKKK
jgi:hypothetical protein